MGFISQWLWLSGLGLGAVVSPGPDFAVVTKNSLLYSRRVGLYTALGIFCGNVWWISVSIAGVSFLIAWKETVFDAVKLIGASYLIYLGVKALLAKKSAEPEEDLAGGSGLKMSALGAFWNGLNTNFWNPKAIMFFISFFSVLLTPATPLWLRAFYGAEISLFALTWFSLLATVLSISEVKRVFRRIRTLVERIMGAVFIGFGFWFAFSKAR